MLEIITSKSEAFALFQTADEGYALVGGVISHGTGGESVDAWFDS